MTRKPLSERPIITVARLRALLHYDPLTGLFTWVAKTSRASRVQIGAVAGGAVGGGGIHIEIDNRGYQAHRLAWLYVHGEWPAGDLDHADCNKANNAIRNLRPATDAQNGANRRLRRDNRCGFKGVSRSARGRYQARITYEKKTINLGWFDTAEAAHAAYASKAVELYGEFARSA